MNLSFWNKFLCWLTRTLLIKIISICTLIIIFIIWQYKVLLNHFILAFRLEILIFRIICIVWAIILSFFYRIRTFMSTWYKLNILPQLHASHTHFPFIICSAWWSGCSYCSVAIFYYFCFYCYFILLITITTKNKTNKLLFLISIENTNKLYICENQDYIFNITMFYLLIILDGIIVSKADTASHQTWQNFLIIIIKETNKYFPTQSK